MFDNNSWLKRARYLGVISLRLTCHDASTDMQYDQLVKPACEITWPWCEVKCWPDRSESPCICFDTPCQEEYDVARIMPLANLVQSSFAKTIAENCYFDVVFFLPLAPKPLMIPQIKWHVSERTVQELECFYPHLVFKLVSEIMIHFRSNVEFR